MKSRRFIILIVAFFMLFLIAFPDKYLASIFSGLELYVLNVLPAILPFFFFSKIMCELNFGYDLGNVLKKPLKKLYNAPSIGGYIMIMSMLSGYPIGAKLISDFYEKNIISTAQAKSISTFTSTSGPLFIVGTVGMAMLHNKAVGLIILLSHYLATFLNGFFYRCKEKNNATAILPPPINTSTVLSESMLNSIVSVAIVGGYIAIFNMILQVFTDTYFIDMFAKIFTFCGLEKDLSLGFVSSFVEITKGCLIMSKSSVNLIKIVPFCTFAITFGGLSVTLQSLTFLAKCKIKPAFYLLSKFTQAILSMAICFTLCLLFL